ncbi:MAG: NAD-dependent epimerase/dehydratase family protein [Balneolaceae bacterium]|nr:MAG: NAD-dependent epimerase/dehydratase family protein [Balneolaceae bacterium]
MNAFVTGATGFIGSHLADSLISNPGFSTVKCLVRNDERWLKSKNYERIKGDLHSHKALTAALDDTDVLFHIAALVKAPSQKEFDFVNVEATEQLIRLAVKTGVKKIVVLSSLAASGPSSGRALTEQDPMKPVSMYGRSKLAMEQRIHEIATDDVSITILRPPAVYGPREEQIFTLFKMMSKGFAPLIGDGNSPLISTIFVDDLVDALIKAAGDNRNGVHTYFVTGQEIANWNQIKHIYSTVMNKQVLSLKIPPNLVKGIAGIIETSAGFFGSYPVVNREKANEMVLEWTCSGKKAEDELGFTPDYSIQEGLSRTLRWYKINNWL